MAQIQQPGSDEGDDEKHAKPSDTGTYQCVFRKAHDSIYMMLKNKQSKRSFSNTFSKSTLMEMDLKQSLDKTIAMLETARAGSQSQVRFEIKFGKADNDKKVTADQLSTTYEKGDALFVIVTVDYSFLYAQHCFKLLEQKREETDILRDIIEDMQAEIDMLKESVSKLSAAGPAMVVYKSSGNTKTSPITWDIEHKACTLEGMVNRTDDNQIVEIGIAGTYELTVRFTYNGTCSVSSNHGLYIHLNGTQILKTYSIGYLGPNIIDVLELQKGDKLHVTAGCSTDSSHSWDKKLNLLMLKKLM